MFLSSLFARNAREEGASESEIDLRDQKYSTTRRVSFHVSRDRDRNIKMTTTYSENIRESIFRKTSLRFFPLSFSFSRTEGFVSGRDSQNPILL